MRLFSGVSLLLLISLFILGCGHKQPIEEPIDYSQIYQRELNKSSESKAKKIIFAATSDYEGFINEFSSVEVLEKDEKTDEVKVLYTEGELAGESRWVYKIIYQTSAIAKDDFSKGMIVIVNNLNPKDLKDTTYENWQVGIVYDVSQLKEKGIVMVEFPKGSTDFFASKESYLYYNIRSVDEPKITDRRKFRSIMD